MTPERAAAVLGIGLDADRVAIERAYLRRARATHPDVASGRPADGAAFHEVVEARSTLVHRLGERSTVGAQRTSTPASTSRPTVAPQTYAPMPQGPVLLATWVGILLLAAFLSIYQVPHPLTIAEPLVRWAVLIGSMFGFARTGRRAFLVIAVVAIAATVVWMVIETTLGSLLGLLCIVPAFLGLANAGLASRRLRRARG